MGKHFYHRLCPYPSFSGSQILRYPWHVCGDSPFLSHIYHPETCNISCPPSHSGFDRGIDLDLLFLFRNPSPPERVQRAEAFQSACSFQQSGSYLIGVFLCLEDLGRFWVRMHRTSALTFRELCQCFNVILHQLTFSNLSKQDVSKNQVIWWGFHTGNSGIPSV